MEHWSNINSAYGRLSSASGIAPSGSGLSPFDLHVMDQRSFGNSGLANGLTNPLPAHATSLPPARLAGMPHPVNYGALHGSMTPLFDTFGTSGFCNQTSYRPVGQALYSLEAVSSHADTMSRLASVISSQPSRSSSLFSADLHSLNDSPIQGLASSAESSEFWPRSGFVPAAGGAPSFIGMPSSSASGGAKKDPPPAHSGSRPAPVVPSKTRFCHELSPVAQQSMKNEFPQRTSVAHLSRSLASSPPTAHVNSPRFETQRFYDGRSSHPMTAANDQRYIESALHMDLNEVLSSDDNSGSLVGHSSFGGCSPTTYSSPGFPVVQKTRTQAAFQPAVELSSSSRGLSESRLHGATYGVLTTNSNAMPASYSGFGVRKDYEVGANVRAVGAVDVACARSADREESFLLSGFLGSAVTQPSISSLLTVQAVADSTTKPKKSTARSSRTGKTCRPVRATGNGFENDYLDDNLHGEGINMFDGRRGRGAKSRKASENRDVGQNAMMLENVDRFGPQLVESPAGASSSPVFAQGVVPEGLLPGSLLQSESYPYGSVIHPGKQVNDSQLYFTNICGNSFVNPSELLIKTNTSENYTTGNEALSYGDSVKCEDTAKQNEPEVIDDEFMHLTEAPKSSDSHKHPTAVKSTKSDVETHSSKANFLASFVSFLSGKKPETLSSVSSLPVCSRPVLPKYIPDPRPRKREENVAESPASDSSTGLQNSRNEMKISMSEKVDMDASGAVKNETSVIIDSARPASKSKVNNRRPILKTGEDSSENRTGQTLTNKGNSTTVRPQPTRRAKTAVEEKRRSVLDGDDSSDEEFKRTTQSRNRRKDDDDYDSDKDPAWKPEREAFGRKRVNSNLDDEPVTPSKRNRKRHSMKSESANEVVSWASPAVAPVSVKTTNLPETKLVVTSPQSFSMSSGNQPLQGTQHMYQKGNFVIEKKDMRNLSSTFSIWKIDSGRLLQKFEPITRDGKLMHQAISTYSSWSDDIKVNYSAIKVNIVVASRGQEVVEVIGGIKTDAESSVGSYESLLEPFNIFVQILLSQSLEPNFLDALHHNHDSYYMDPLAKIEAAIESGLEQLKKACKWTKEFLVVVDKMSNFSLLRKITDSSCCQATEDAVVPAVVCVRFSGTAYDSFSLKSLEDAESFKEIALGELTWKYLPTYHGLRHLKFTFYQKCKAKVNELKIDSEVEDHQLLDSCLQNLAWMKELFTTLEYLLKEANNVADQSAST